MSDKRLVLFSALFLILVIGLMSWRSMHPAALTTIPAAAGYYIDDKTLSPSAIPDDNTPLTLFQGGFYAFDGIVHFTHQDIPPTLFAQRQVTLRLKLEAIPTDTADSFQKIEQLLQAWTARGTLVSDISLDYRPRKPDFTAYSAFLKSFKSHFKADSHALVPVIDSAWLTPARKRGLKLLRQDVPFFVIDMPKEVASTELMHRLSAFEHEFQIRFPSANLPSGFDVKSLRANSLFQGYLLTLDPRKPFVKKEGKIGIFPQF